jgi:hypothetical protein
MYPQGTTLRLKLLNKASISLPVADKDDKSSLKARRSSPQKQLRVEA